MADSMARRTLETARFYLSQAETVGLDNRAVFLRHLETAIIYARSVTFHLQTEHDAVPGFKRWWTQQQEALGQDRRAKFFLESRNFVLKEGSLPVRQDTELTVGSGLLVLSGTTVRLVHSARWYKRSPKIIWRDIRHAVLGPLRRWRDRRAEERRIREAKEREARESGATITHELYFRDQEWSATPALTLLSRHLDTLQAIVATAETQFGTPPARGERD